MAPALRYINKLSVPLITSKHLGAFQHKYFVNLQCKQQHSIVQTQHKASRNEQNRDNIDNREIIREVSKTNINQLKRSDQLCSSKASKGEVVFSSDSSEDSGGKPSPEKLLNVYTQLGESLPNLFIQPMDYSIYHEDVIFEDRIRNLKTIGLMPYVRQVALLRTIGHIKFAYVRFEILKITQHPEDGTVRIRWRIRGISAFKVMFQFWKYKLWEWKEMFEKSESWYDGYSTFFVNAEGKIVKHIADKMMPDSDTVSARESTGLNTAKLALMITLIPRFSDIGWFV